MEKIDNGRDSRFCVKKLQKNGEYFFYLQAALKDKQEESMIVVIVLHLSDVQKVIDVWQWNSPKLHVILHGVCVGQFIMTFFSGIFHFIPHKR